MTPSHPILQPNTILQNRYQIKGPLGQGGMGAVYDAWDLRLQGLVVAVKENFDNSPAAQMQFQTEAAILARLTHPALTRVTDYFIEPSGRQYLVMDFVAGQDLEKIVEQRGRIAESEAVRWIVETLNALEYLHSQTPPIIHRDIKPPNIKQRPDGKIVLVDFGIAKVYNPSQKTQTGARAGTPGYAPLEQYGRGSTDPRTDLYSIGATLYFLLVGQPPPEATDLAAGLRQLRLPSAQGIAVSRHVEQAIVRALAADAKQRFQSAREFRSALLQSAPSRASAAPTAVAAPRVPAPVSRPRPYTSTPDYAPFSSRAIAYIIDSFISAVPSGAAYACLLLASAGMSGSSSSNSNDSILALFSMCLLGLLCLSAFFPMFYFIRMTSVSGQTLGKRMLKIKVVRLDDGNPPTVLYSLVRYLGYMLNVFTFYIGWLLPLFDEQKQALHDKVAGTIVIRA